MRNLLPITLTFALFLSLLACSGQDNNQVADRARLEGKAQAEEQLKKDRELLEEQTLKQKALQDEQIEKQRGLQTEQIKKERNATDSRAKEMEASLSKLQNFYEDNSGTYEGTMKSATDQFSILITLSSSIPRYTESRIRTPAEIETDLVNLTYQAQILQWIPPSKESAVGCSVTGLRPNSKSGTLNLISADCPSTYQLILNRTSISGTARRQNNPDSFDIYTTRIGKAPVKKAATKTNKKKLRK